MSIAPRNAKQPTCSGESICWSIGKKRNHDCGLASARVPRATFGISPNGEAPESARRDAVSSDRDGRAPQLPFPVPFLRHKPNFVFYKAQPTSNFQRRMSGALDFQSLMFVVRYYPCEKNFMPTEKRQRKFLHGKYRKASWITALPCRFSSPLFHYSITPLLQRFVIPFPHVPHRSENVAG
jgi:hypothetical protein